MNYKDSELITEAIAQKNTGNFGESENLYNEAIELNSQIYTKPITIKEIY